jgi:predicted amidohydrolase
MKRREIRLASVSHRPTHGTDTPQNTGALMSSVRLYIERAARMGADLLAFPEIYPQAALREFWHHAEPSEGGTLLEIRELAKKHKLAIVWPRCEYDAVNGLRNSSVLVDQKGDVLGRYHKMFPTVPEIGWGVLPGTTCPVFETDFGRVGMLICFDLNFQEVHDELHKGRPDIVVFSSMYRGGLQAQSLAYELGAFVVTSIDAELGQIIDRAGRVLKESTYETLAVAPVNTNSVAMHMDFNWSKMDEMLTKYPKSLSFDYHTREAFYVVESRDKDIDELIKEFGLETADRYWKRSRDTRTAALAKLQKKT